MIAFLLRYILKNLEMIFRSARIRERKRYYIEKSTHNPNAMFENCEFVSDSIVDNGDKQDVTLTWPAEGHERAVWLPPMAMENRGTFQASQ